MGALAPCSLHPLTRAASSGLRVLEEDARTGGIQSLKEGRRQRLGVSEDGGVAEKGAICLRNPERDTCLHCTCSKKGKDKCHLPSTPTPARASRPRGKDPSAPADTSKGKRRAHSNDMMETRGAKWARGGSGSVAGGTTSPAVGKGAPKLTVKIPPPAAGKGKTVTLPVKKRKIVPLDAGGVEVVIRCSRSPPLDEDENEGHGYGNAGDDQAGGDNDETHDDNGETTNETRPPTSLLSQRAPYPLMAALSLGPGNHTPWWTVTDVGLTCLSVPESVEALRTLETQIRLQASRLQVLGTQHLEAAAQCTEAAEVVRYMINCNDEQSLGETLESVRRARDSRREEYRERREAERIEQAQREAERIEQAQQEAERIEKERRREEEERIENERRREEEERIENERIENERIENERIERRRRGSIRRGSRTRGGGRRRRGSRRRGGVKLRRWRGGRWKSRWRNCRRTNVRMTNNDKALESYVNANEFASSTTRGEKDRHSVKNKRTMDHAY
ncbi:hypothetical protein OE88DRAFT_1733415 [Heliocybe sulcata]|uniref:Uncharacterized protein n=1 Tax=Heliocybe sulcata TaxID=5364 RepID=A0A5C3N837_9AGAM|nr:hypothetical protein OE88DRAFT_1733415 [Heliocybe sulcata]